jgi:hypothetical protein
MKKQREEAVMAGMVNYRHKEKNEVKLKYTAFDN